MGVTAKNYDERATLPKMAPGSPPAWELMPRDYRRLQRSFYFMIPEPKTKRVGSKEFRDRWNAHTQDRVISVFSQTMSHILGSGPRVEASQCYEFSDLPFVELELEDTGRVFDVFDYAAGSAIVIEPPWWPEYQAWKAGLPLGGRPTHEMTALDEFARHLGYDVVLGRGTGAHLLRLDHMRLVCVWRKGTRCWSHEDLVSKALEDGRTVPDGIMQLLNLPVDAGEHQRKVVRALPLLPELKALIGTVARLNTTMRQQDHSVRQDVELSLLTVIAAKKAIQVLAEFMVIMEYSPGVARRAAIARMPMPGPGVSGKLRPRGQEGWSDGMVELSMQPAWDEKQNRTLYEVDDSVEWIVEVMLRHVEQLVSSTGDDAVLRVASCLEWLMAHVGWSVGTDFLFRVEDTYG